MKHIFFIILTTSCIYSYTQTIPGYLGKRKSLEIKLNLLPSFYGEDLSQLDETVFNFKGTLEYNITISKRTEMSISYDLYRNKLTAANIKSGYYSSGYSYSVKNNNDLKMSTNCINLNFNFYYKNYIAPIGNYFTLGLGYASSKQKNKTSQVYVNERNIHSNNNQTTIYNVEKNKTRVSSLKINLGFYSKSILKDDLYFSYGIGSNLFFTLNNSNKLSYLNIESVQSDYIWRNVKRFLPRDNWITLKFGLGILL